MATEPNERLRQARLAAGYHSAADAARAFGWNTVTYQAHEAGMRGIRPDVARRYAAALKVSQAWLLTGSGESGSVTRKVPVVGFVGAGAEVMALDDHAMGAGYDEVDAPPDCAPDTVAIIVRGDSCYPIFEDGELLLYSERRTDVDNFVNRSKPLIVGLDDGRRFLKQLSRGGRNGTYTLLSPNAAPIHDVHVEWVARIDWTRPHK